MSIHYQFPGNKSSDSKPSKEFENGMREVNGEKNFYESNLRI